MSAITGGCHYAWNCKGYQKECSECPAVTTSSLKKRIASNFAHKKKYISKTPITTICSTDSLEYQIIIIEPGFNGWLQSTARPEGYYSQSFLEGRNRLYVQAWNQRNLQPHTYDPNLYELRIDYDPFTDYGYDVNYKLYNYFISLQLKYKPRVSTCYPRI